MSFGFIKTFSNVTRIEIDVGELDASTKHNDRTADGKPTWRNQLRGSGEVVIPRRINFKRIFELGKVDSQRQDFVKPSHTRIYIPERYVGGLYLLVVYAGVMCVLSIEN